MATNQDKIATIGDIKTLLATAKEKGVTIKKSDGTEWAVPSSFTDNSLCPTYNQINGTVLPSYADNASDKLSSTDGVVIGNFKGSATAYTDTQLVRLGDITLKATSLDSSSFSLTTNSKVETSCAVSATCEYTYDVNVSSYSYDDADASTSTSTVTGTSGTWSGTDSSTSNVLSNQGQNMSFTNTREHTISCSVTLKGETMSDSLTLTQPKREQGKFISSSSTEDSHALEAEVNKTSFDCNGGTATVTWYHVYGSVTSKTYEDTCGVQYTETSGEGRKRDNIGTEEYNIPSIACDPMTGSTTTSHTLTSSYTYTDSEGNSQTVDGSVDVSQKCESCEMSYKYTMIDGTIKSGTCRSNLLSFNSIQGEYYNKAQKIELFNCINGFASDSSYFGGDEITSITMTDSVSAITSSFAKGAAKLTTVRLSSKLKSIPTWAFRNCDSLTNINFIPEGVETIGDSAFVWCQSVSSVTIPSTVKSIGNYSFGVCIKLKHVYMSSPTPPTISDTSFDIVDNDYIIHVPCEHEEAYKTASENWVAIASHVVGDCSCNSCYTVSTSELSYIAATSNTLVCTCQVTSSQSICSTLKRYVPDISAIKVDGNWLTVSRTNATSARDGFRVYATYSENTSKEERNCKLTIPLVSSNSELTCGNKTLEVNLVQKGSSEVEELCFESTHRTYECGAQPSGTLLIAPEIVRDSNYCKNLTFVSPAYTLTYSSPYITVESVTLSDDKLKLNIYGSMTENNSGNKTGINMQFSAQTASGTIVKRDIGIEQESCSFDCHKCFTLQEIEGQNVTLSGNTYTFQGDGTQSESWTIARILKNNIGDCSTIPQYNALELQDLGYGTDWLTIDTFNEASGDYVRTSGIISSNPTNNERTMRLHYYTSGSSESCPMDVVIKQKSSSVTCNCEESNYFSWITYCTNTGLTDSIAVITLTSNTSSSCSAITYDGATVDADFVTVTSVSEAGRGSSNPSFIVYGTVANNTSPSPRTYNVTLTSSTQPCTYTASVKQNGAQVASSCKNVSIYACANSSTYITKISDTEVRIGKQGQSGWSFVGLKATDTRVTLGRNTDITYRMDFGSNDPWLKYIQRNNNGPFGFADNAQIVFFGCSTENDSGVERTAIMTVTYTDASGVCEKNIKITQAAGEEVPFQITGVTLQRVCKEDRKAYYTIDYQGTAPSSATCKVKTFQYGGQQYGVVNSAVTVNHEVQSILIHPSASSASTIYFTVIPNSGVNTSNTSFTATIESNNWEECGGGTITLTSPGGGAVTPIITSETTSQIEYSFDLSYSGSKTIDTSNASITLYAYINITTTSNNCPQCALKYNNAPLCEHVIRLTQNEIAKLVTEGSLTITRLITIANESPSVCEYTRGTFYGTYGSSNTTSIRIGEGFLPNMLGH